VTCPALETVAAWVLDELPEEEGEAFEAHYFGCASCFANARRLQQLKQQLQASLPPVLTSQRHRELTAERQGLPAIHVQPGEQATIRLGHTNAVGVWVMHCRLDGVTRVDLEARGPDGQLFFTERDVPFDADRGQVVLACQVHYRALPMGPLFQARLTSVEVEGPRLLGEYMLNHEFESL
jgi:hypothetical protein